MLSVSQIKITLFLSCIALQGCSDKFYIQKPFKAGLSDQVFMANFIVEEEYDYRVALVFDWKKPYSYESSEKQRNLIGDPSQRGIMLPLILRIIKDGETYYDQVTISDMASSLGGFCYNKNTKKNDPLPGFWEDYLANNPCESRPGRQRIYGPIRALEVLTLKPGNYYIEVKSFTETKEFIDLDTYIDFGPYNPKI